MAKRHKSEDAEPEEGYEFIPPEFDEDQFIHKEMVSFHTTTVLFLAGIVAGLVSWALFSLMDGGRTGWFLGIVVVAATFGALRPLFKLLKIDIAHWGRREWLGTAFLIFFAWLAFFIMFVNPPISDFADPDVNLYVTPSAQQDGGDIILDLFLHDNDEVVDHESTLTRDGTAVAVTFDLASEPWHRTATLTDAASGDYVWQVSATDAKGRSATVWNNFTVQPQVLDVRVGDLTVPTDSVFVDVPDDLDIWAVYADLGDRRVYFEEDDKVGGWIATANFLGWQAGNNTFTIVVEEHNRFDGQTLIPGGRLTDGPHTVQVTSPGEYDDSIPRAQRIDPPTVRVPGPGMAVVALGIIGLAVWRRQEP